MGRRWGSVPLIDMLKEAVVRTGCLKAVTSVAGTSSLKPEALAERLMLAIFGYGANTGIRAVASGGHALGEDDIRYVPRRYLTPQVATDIANATFTARDVALWGEVTTPVRLHARARLRSECFHRVALQVWRPRHPHLLAHRARVHGGALPDPTARSAWTWPSAFRSAALCQLRRRTPRSSFVIVVGAGARQRQQWHGKRGLL